MYIKNLIQKYRRKLAQVSEDAEEYRHSEDVELQQCALKLDSTKKEIAN